MAVRGPINPYLVGPPVTGAHGFYGRQDLVEAVVNTLTNARQNAIVLHGQRRIGKTSLLHRLQRDELLQQNHLPIFFDMQLYEGFSPARTLIHLAQIIADKLSLGLTLPSETDLTANYRQFQRTFLSKVFPLLNHKRILILFDEFDVAVPTGPASADTLLGYLRSLIAEESERLAFVFVVGQRLDLLNEGYQRLFKGAQAKPVGRLSQNDTYTLLTELGQQGRISYPAEVLNEIWALTNGHPYLTQLVGFEIFDRLQKQGASQATLTDVTTCLDRAMESGQAALDWFWRGFVPEQQWVLAAVADLTDQNRGVSDSEINKSLQQHLLIMTPLARDKAYRDLLEGDFLTETEARHYRFAVEFIRRWIIKYHPLKDIQRQIEEISPEALNYYRLGETAYSKGDAAQAEKHYRQALEYNPHFARARVDLAIALRAQNKIEEAIKEGKEAYKVDPTGVRDDLINFYMIHIRRLEENADIEAILDDAWRILEIDFSYPEARQLVSDIYLDQAEVYLLEQGSLTEALRAVGKLVERPPISSGPIEPGSIIHDPEVSRKTCELWWNYAEKLIRQDSPNWVEAQRVLASLESLGLLDETMATRYNELTLNKVLAQLDQADLETGLAIVQNEFKEPLPTDAIKTMLLDYSRKQVEQGNWELAEKALKGLQDRFGDEDSQATLVEHYRDWGDKLLEDNKFEEAIDVYSRSDASEFKPKIAHAYLGQGAWRLDRDELALAHDSYQQALALQNTKANRERVQQDLIDYFHNRRQHQAWSLVEEAWTMLKRLDLAGATRPTLERLLRLGQAKTELDQGRMRVAFKYLTLLESEANVEIKALIKTHIQQQALKEKWAAGNATLKCLAKLLVGDAEIIDWRANWLFLWAKALFPEDKRVRRPVRAKALCQKVIADAPAKTPLLDLLDTVPAKPEAGSLRRHVYALKADISVFQAQICLEQNNLPQAVEFFEDVLKLQPPSDELKQDILNRLEAFIRDREFKEDWDQAQNARKEIQRLGLGDRGDEQIEKEIHQLRLRLKEDDLNSAFDILDNRLKTVKGEKYREIITTVNQFSRLYVGRGRWIKARKLLEHLQAWLTPEDNPQEIINARNTLNHDRLDFVRCRHAAINPLELPSEGIERRIKHVEAQIRTIRAGYKQAKVLGLKVEAIQAWIEDLVKTGLVLGQAYLTNHNLEMAGQTYQEILDVTDQRLDLKNEISQSLYTYSERMLLQDKPEWLEARLALEKLRNFKPPAPYDPTQVDPRVHGAIQRIILLHTNALKRENQVVEMFKELNRLPTPRPEGEIKVIIKHYSRKRRGTDEGWSHAIAALKQLDEFLKGDRPESRSQDALERLVEGLEERGLYFENQDRLDEAAQDYFEALQYTRIAAESRRRNIELAADFIRVKFNSAQNALSSDPLEAEIPPAISAAIRCYQDILDIPEHRCLEDENKLNKELYEHAVKLADKRQWERGYDILDRFDILYPAPPDNYKSLFAGWRQDLALREVCAWLAERQLDPAFARLGWLKSWLDERNIPQAGWSDYEDKIKTRLYLDFCQPWLDEPAWELAIDTLANLTDLIPNDSEIIGWEVKAMCQWAEALRADDMAGAIKRYREALGKAPAQQSIPPEEIEADLLDSQLDYAQQYLDSIEPGLEQAIAIYKEVLDDKPDDHNHLDRANKIRKALKLHSKHLVEQESPAWAEAHKALAFLPDLGLNNDEVITWRQDLILAEVNAWLKQNDLDAAFACLDTLDTVQQPWPRDAIQDILHQHSQEYAKNEAWSTAIEILERFGNKIRKDDSTRQWVHQELTNLGDILSKDNLEGADKAFETAVRFH